MCAINMLFSECLLSIYGWIYVHVHVVSSVFYVYLRFFLFNLSLARMLCTCFPCTRTCPPLQPTMPPFPPAALAALGDPSKLPSGAPHLNPAFLQDMAQGGNMVRGGGGGGNMVRGGREGEMG